MTGCREMLEGMRDALNKLDQLWCSEQQTWVVSTLDVHGIIRTLIDKETS